MKSIALYIKKKSIFIGLKFCKIDFYVQIIFDLVLPLKNGKTLACPFNCCLNPPKANDKLDPKHCQYILAARDFFLASHRFFFRHDIFLRCAVFNSDFLYCFLFQQTSVKAYVCMSIRRI